jgi:hypothetical protein
MSDQVDPEYVSLLKVLNEVNIQIDSANNTIQKCYKNLEDFKNLRNKILNTISKYYPDSSRN